MLNFLVLYIFSYFWIIGLFFFARRSKSFKILCIQCWVKTGQRGRQNKNKGRPMSSVRTEDMKSITQTDNLHFSQINTAVPSSISHQHCKPLITFGSVYYLFKEKIADSISIFLSVTLNFKHDTFTETVFGTSVCYCSLH